MLDEPSEENFASDDDLDLNKDLRTIGDEEMHVQYQANMK